MTSFCRNNHHYVLCPPGKVPAKSLETMQGNSLLHSRLFKRSTLGSRAPSGASQDHGTVYLQSRVCVACGNICTYIITIHKWCAMCHMWVNCVNSLHLLYAVTFLDISRALVDKWWRHDMLYDGLSSWCLVLWINHLRPVHDSLLFRNLVLNGVGLSCVRGIHRTSGYTHYSQDNFEENVLVCLVVLAGGLTPLCAMRPANGVVIILAPYICTWPVLCYTHMEPEFGHPYNSRGPCY